MGFSSDAPRLLRCLPGRVGSRRDPTERKTMRRMVFCFVCMLVFACSPEPSQTTREAHLTCNMTKRRAASGRNSAAKGEHWCRRHETILWIVSKSERADIHGSPGR